MLPSFIIILIISRILREFQSFKAVQYAFNGIRAGVLAMILKALWNMYKKVPKGTISYIVIAASFVLTAFLNVPVLTVIIGCAAFGLISSLYIRRRTEK